MKTAETWAYIHSERAELAQAWTTLAPGQWAAESWCSGWSVQDAAGHILHAAEQTTANFYKEMRQASGSACLPTGPRGAWGRSAPRTLSAASGPGLPLPITRRPR